MYQLLHAKAAPLIALWTLQCTSCTPLVLSLVPNVPRRGVERPSAGHDS